MNDGANQQIVVVAYDLAAVEEVVTEWTPRRLLAELRGGTFDEHLDGERRVLLDELCQGWTQRALGDMPLRDALLTDPARGLQVWDSLCEWRCVARYAVPRSEATAGLLAACVGGGVLHLEDLPASIYGATIDSSANREPRTENRLRESDSRFLVLGSNVITEGLALAAWPADTPPPRYPPPARLEQLLPARPPALPPDDPPFEQPVGWRRAVATALALLGVGLVGLPLLFGQAPTAPAGLPLALLTLALLVGIKARVAGYGGSLCIWLVANHPGFHHDNLFVLWTATPLLAIGVVLLALDPRIRAMWRWIRRGMRG